MFGDKSSDGGIIAYVIGINLLFPGDNRLHRLESCCIMLSKKAEMLWADRKVRVHLQALGTGAIFYERTCCHVKANKKDFELLC